MNGIFVRSISGSVTGFVDTRSIPLGRTSTIELQDRSPRGITRETNWTGGAIEFVALPPGDYDVVVRSGNDSHDYGSVPVRAWSLTSFAIGARSASASAEALGLGVAILAGSLLYAATLSSMQYTRLVKENLLQRKVRSLICEYLRDNPGATFSSIRHGLGLQNGVTAYHLAVLERQGMLRSKSHRGHRWYYLEGTMLSWKDLPLSPTQAAIVKAVQGSPGVGVRVIARLTGERASSVSYSLKGLAREGVLRIERSGRRVRYFAVAEPNRSLTVSRRVLISDRSGILPEGG